MVITVPAGGALRSFIVKLPEGTTAATKSKSRRRKTIPRN